ncbi:hypothetical protein FHR83_001595 [Actinoplanes campanulatus]|uniref:Uncharacterized protein n=1 Tax=Actinoplanes campanulatus TaxID=113559 RepID=A0A7W5ACV4_9ACTN|nr:hypothetical protein [Actinoplanes campanulatus]MBB3093946.1 hypothetical protein [Actinoplanes campanulatus]GGN33632.1 hypothetical protein GCM10010109_55840 [Actinoplanes campanulatus]GID38359.1 hypothetical protein Aca09nite_48650 [Actinoplanes campanulatus]
MSWSTWPRPRTEGRRPSAHPTLPGRLHPGLEPSTKAIWLYKGNGSFEFGEQKEIWTGWGVFDMIV